jgi:hypothetical protein
LFFLDLGLDFLLLVLLLQEVRVEFFVTKHLLSVGDDPLLDAVDVDVFLFVSVVLGVYLLLLLSLRFPY